MTSRVLVTGGTGYVASHVIHQLLEKGYNVRTTARSSSDERCAFIKDMHPRGSEVEIVSANLLEAECWDKAVEGCDYVIHTASPFIMRFKDEENDVIKPAVSGTTNVLKACAKYKEQVKRVVVTSSVAAVMVGHSKERYNEGPMTELDFSVPDKTHGYELSKLKAERACWALAKEEGLSVNVVCPGLVFGPYYAKHHNNAESSLQLLNILKLPSLANASIPLSDVRDIADIHVKAMECIEENERFIATSELGCNAKIVDVAKWVNTIENGPGASESIVPDFLVKMGAIFSNTMSMIVPYLSVNLSCSNDHAKKVLQHKFRCVDQAVKEHLYCLIKYDAIKKPKNFDSKKLDFKFYKAETD